MSSPASATDPYQRQHVAILDTEIAYVDTGRGDPVVFLHGNPTFSYLWRNIIPYLESLGRCLAPDLVGMGDSGKAPDGAYRFIDHVRYLDTWLDTLGLTKPIVLVGHDWGSALGFHWAHRHPTQVRGIAYMEAIVQPLSWAEGWSEVSRDLFKALRSPAGEELILQQNAFVERILPARISRGLSQEAMEMYRRPYRAPGPSRQPTLTWPRELPLDGDPLDVTLIVDSYAKWLATSVIPKLFINADPGALLTGAYREFCRTWPNQQEVTVKGFHYIQEDSPDEIGQALAQFVKQLSA